VNWIETTTEQHIPPRAEKGLFQLYLFLGLSAALSWAIWLWPPSNQAFYVSVSGRRVTWPLNNLRLLIGNCAPGVLALIWVSAKGKRQLRELLSSLFAWRVQPKWYLLSIAFPCGVFIVSLCSVVVFFSAELRQPPIMALMNSLVALPFGPVWEEIAWRAFALRKLQGRYSRLISALIIGVYWAAWHIPLWLVTLNYLTITILLIICVNLVCWSVIFAFQYDRSGQSLPVTILLHATYLTVQNLVAGMVAHDAIHMILTAAVLSASLAVVIANHWTSQPVQALPRPTIHDGLGRG
jgi:membrane protease YdiL (CAAX protease family)